MAMELAVLFAFRLLLQGVLEQFLGTCGLVHVCVHRVGVRSCVFIWKPSTMVPGVLVVLSRSAYL